MDGPLQLIATGPPGDAPLQLAFPVRGAPQPNRQYKVRQAEAFKHAYLVHEGAVESMEELWRGFVAAVTAAGYELTGESRTVFLTPGGGSDISGLELQLGIE